MIILSIVIGRFKKAVKGENWFNKIMTVTLNVHLCSISKYNLPTSGHSTVVNPSIRKIGKSLKTGWWRRTRISFIVTPIVTFMSNSVDDVWERFSWTDSEPVDAWAGLILRVREDWALKSQRVNWTDRTGCCRPLNDSIVCSLDASYKIQKYSLILLYNISFIVNHMKAKIYTATLVISHLHSDPSFQFFFASNYKIRATKNKKGVQLKIQHKKAW